jgi:cellulose synthase/poly-beta-1,6-N-acetylglucosamine synthase-like glycosyltransferase
MKNSAADTSTGGSEAATSSDPPALPSASVVIATRSRPELLESCLRGVVRQDMRPLEVLVVDNTSGEQATQEAALAHGARYIIESAEGLAVARNRGARESTTEIVAYLDDDAVPERDWLAALLPEFLDPLVAAVAGRILACEVEAAAVTSMTEGVNFGGPQRIVFDRRSPDWFQRANFGGIGQGANMAIRRTVLRTWPGFNERLGKGTRVGAIGMEEHYAFFSLIDRGYRVVYTPGARVRHPFPQTDAELRARELSQLTAASFHCALLFAEEPRYRWRAARYALEAVGGKPRPWRERMGPATPSIRGWQGALARFRGVMLYLASRLESRRSRERVRATD